MEVTDVDVPGTLPCGFFRNGFTTKYSLVQTSDVTQLSIKFPSSYLTDNVIFAK